VETAISQPLVRHGFFWKVSFIAGFGGILYGYDMGIIAAALIFVRSTFSLSTRMEEVVVSVVLVGSMIGAVLGGTFADRARQARHTHMGRRHLIIGSVLAPLSPNVDIDRSPGPCLGSPSASPPSPRPSMSQSWLRLNRAACLSVSINSRSPWASRWPTWSVIGLQVRPSWRLMFGLGAIPALFSSFLC
jgi:hypothetical protein